MKKPVEPSRLRSFVLASFAAALILPLIGGTNAQEMLRLTLANRDSQNWYVVVFDETCRIPLYQDRLAAKSSTIIRACRDARGRAHVSVHDARGRKTVYRNLTQASQVVVRVR